MKVTFEELQAKLEYYVEKAKFEDVEIYNKDIMIAKIVSPEINIESIFGIIPEETPVEQILEEKRIKL